MNSIIRTVFKKPKTMAPQLLKRSVSLNELVSTAPKKISKQLKKIKILFINQISATIEIPQESAKSLNVGWLLEEAKKKLRESDKGKKRITEISRIVALRTSNGYIPLDYLLTLPEETLEYLPIKLTLQTVIASESEPQINEKSTSLQDFELCGSLGKGAFARIYLARSKRDGKFYALKQLRKQLLSQKELERVIEERDIMRIARDSGIVHFYSSFQTDQFCYLVIKFCPGGDMLTHLKTNGSLSEQEAKYYVKSVVKSLKYLHSRGIIHRDLKAENLLLDLEGRAYIADFGLSKMMGPEDLNYTICGTPKYCAPEILQKEGYKFSVDHYNVGTLAFELVVNDSPFTHNKNLNALFADIMEKKAVIPSNLSVAFQDFLCRLLVKDPKKRLGANGINDILNHPWLEDAPLLPPINTPYVFLENIVRKMNPEADSKILIDYKNWFGKNNQLQRRATYIEGFSFRLESDLQNDSFSDSFLSKDGASPKSLPKSHNVGGLFSTVPSRNISKVGEHTDDQGSQKNRNTSIIISKKGLPVIPDDLDSSLLDVDEFEDNVTKDSLTDIKLFYTFQSHSNTKNFPIP